MNLTHEQFNVDMFRRLNRIHEVPSMQEIQRLNMDTLPVEELAEWVANRYGCTLESGQRISKQVKHE